MKARSLNPVENEGPASLKEAGPFSPVACSVAILSVPDRTRTCGLLLRRI